MFCGVTSTYSLRKGNGLKFNGHDYGILFCGTDGSLLLDRSGHEIIPDKTVLPYGIKLIHPDLEPRKITLEKEEYKANSRTCCETWARESRRSTRIWATSWVMLFLSACLNSDGRPTQMATAGPTMATPTACSSWEEVGKAGKFTRDGPG